MPHLYHLKLVFDKLDDIVDHAQASDLLSLGDTSLGPELNSFLQNLLDEQDLDALHQFVIKKLITQKELYAFLNLFSHLLVKQAALTLQYSETTQNDLKYLYRRQLAKKNLEVSGGYVALMMHLIKKDKRILEIVHHKEQNALTYDHLIQIYPLGTKSGELQQILHDVIEFRHDLYEEEALNQITPNYFLAELEDDFYSLDIQKVKEFPKRAVSFYELPKNIQQKFKEIAKEYRKQSFTIHVRAGIVYSLLWEYEKKVGFFKFKPHPDKKEVWKTVQFQRL